MKATIKLSKTTELLTAGLDRVYLRAPEICKKAVYDGAGPVADTMRSNIEDVPTDKKTHTWGEGGYGGAVCGLTESQKQGILDGLGISPLEEKFDSMDKKIGVEGYNDTITKKYPKGQPNAMILRSVESGTQWHAKYPVVRKTANQTRNKVKKIMEKTISEELKKNLR